MPKWITNPFTNQIAIPYASVGMKVDKLLEKTTQSNHAKVYFI